MATEQTVQSTYAFGKSLFDFFNLYARFLVSYTVAIFFLFFAFTFFVGERIQISAQTKLIFLGLSVLLVFVSYIIHRQKISIPKIVFLVILWGNVFGFLFNIIYVATNITRNYGYPLVFGGIEKFVFFKERAEDLTLIEEMYAFVGGIIFIMLLGIIAMQGLSMRDALHKRGNPIKALLPIIIAIAAALGLFLMIIWYQNIFQFAVYAIVGSMLFIYGRNLFSQKHSLFLKR